MDIRVENLSFAYPGRKIFSAVNFELAAGKLHYLAGCNGAGKSTLLKLLCGYIKPQSGRIMLDEKDLLQIPHFQRAQMLGVLHQHISCELDFTVRETIFITASGRFPRLGRINAEDLQKFHAILERFELYKLENALFRELSGGEQQRVLAAGLFLLEPAIMLLDEPTSAFDPAWRNRMITMLKDYARTHTVLAITHDMELLAQADGELLLLDNSGKLHSGSANEVLTSEMLTKVYGTPAGITTDVNGRKHITFA